MIKHLEIKTYENCGVMVHVKIDYDKSEISLVEANKDYDAFNYPDKKWLFACRKLEFMRDWLNILEGMRFAIESAYKELKEYKDMKKKEKEDDICNIMMEATDIVKNKKK